LTPDAVNRLIKRIGERAGFTFLVHCHMLRHACGYALANAGHATRALQNWLGHRSIQHTVRYTELAPTRFKDFWREYRRSLRRFGQVDCCIVATILKRSGSA
jgi:site-specific recombinase XerD